jgi:hypothetical protein
VSRGFRGGGGGGGSLGTEMCGEAFSGLLGEARLADELAGGNSAIVVCLDQVLTFNLPVTLITWVSVSKYFKVASLVSNWLLESLGSRLVVCKWF